MPGLLLQDGQHDSQAFSHSPFKSLRVTYRRQSVPTAIVHFSVNSGHVVSNFPHSLSITTTMSLISVRDGLVISLCVLVHFIYRNRRRRLLPFPPGPSPWPIVKNTFTIPLINAHGYYKELGAKFGSKLLYLEALGQPMLIINDIRIAQDLLEKRSALYSSRPAIPMLNDVVGVRAYFSVMPYGDYWRAHRRMFQQHFAEKYLVRNQERAMEFIRKGLLANLLESPENFDEHIRNCIGGIAVSVTYGLPVQRKRDPFVHFSETTFAVSSATAAPGKFLVNIVPSLKHVPEWMPGAGFKQVAKEVRANLLKLIEEPFEASVKMMEKGTAPMCFITDMLERHRHSPDYETQSIYIKQTAAMVFAAVSETTVTALNTFILGMLQRPDVLKKAQKEVDDIVGTNRLPEFSDIPHLEYLSAVIKETLRWNPVAPMGVPHHTSEEDVYMGYYIPKGCTVFANAYAMLHDDEIFPEPQEFKPERFIKDDCLREDLPDPEYVATFGFGRRVCPGAHIARSTLHIAAASLLHLFDIAPELDGDGKPIKVVPQFNQTSTVSWPLPFRCKMTPRAGRDVKDLLEGYIGSDPI
ncbi:hypothetical protein D9756_005134 [Leucocoprinus leucothites]|uniref:Cytochrome P450 n=1 Tax=Leucocoprinus leucothites TaxID=201217 RepID=A0A8H5G966_9AGAR|nr:hypothetical protein D9756_005134 [Leucoagaricus leucothites]